MDWIKASPLDEESQQIDEAVVFRAHAQIKPERV
jgi:hypothetical protein